MAVIMTSASRMPVLLTVPLMVMRSPSGAMSKVLDVSTGLPDRMCPPRRVGVLYGKRGHSSFSCNNNLRGDSAAVALRRPSLGYLLAEKLLGPDSGDGNAALFVSQLFLDDIAPATFDDPVFDGPVFERRAGAAKTFGDLR